jgi:hypothetical protein
MPTDITADIQHKVSNLGTGGGLIRIPSGNWVISSRIDIIDKGATIIEGDGPGATTIQCNSADRTFHFVRGNHCAIKNLRLSGGNHEWWTAGLTNLPAIEFVQCLFPSVSDCWFADHDTGIAVGSSNQLPPDGHNPDYMCMHARINKVDFEGCRIGINLINQLNTSIQEVHGDGNPGSVHPGAKAVIVSYPTEHSQYDTLVLRNIQGFSSREFGVYINLANGVAGRDGRNHIGWFNNIIFESTTSYGIYVNAAASYGRFDLSEYYGDRVVIENCHHLRVSHCQFNLGHVFNNCPNFESVCITP